jgi:hypothetical protein
MKAVIYTALVICLAAMVSPRASNRKVEKLKIKENKVIEYKIEVKQPPQKLLNDLRILNNNVKKLESVKDSLISCQN